MRTVFVNPSKPRTRARRRTAGGSVKIAKLEKKLASVQRKVSGMKTKSVKRRVRRTHSKARRRNAGIAPFIAANPLILRNPRKRHAIRRRRNPSNLLPPGGMKGLLVKAAKVGGGAGIGLLANAYGINKIENSWARNGVRLVAAIFGGALLKGEMGGAFAGAVMYPAMQELALEYVPQFPSQAVADFDPTRSASATSADLNVLAADLEAALGDADYEELSTSNLW